MVTVLNRNGQSVNFGFCSKVTIIENPNNGYRLIKAGPEHGFSRKYRENPLRTEITETGGNVGETRIVNLLGK